MGPGDIGYRTSRECILGPRGEAERLLLWGWGWGPEIAIFFCPKFYGKLRLVLKIIAPGLIHIFERNLFLARATPGWGLLVLHKRFERQALIVPHLVSVTSIHHLGFKY